MELTIEQVLQQGIAAHKERKLEEAERLYRAILQSQPLHPDANHNLGLIAVTFNKADAALPLFKTALEANPKIEQFWLSYINALIKEQQFENAKQVFEQAKTQGVAAEKLNVLETKLTPTAQVNEPKLDVQNKSLSFSQKRKKLSEQKNRKKKATKQNLKANNSSQQQLTSLLEHYQNGRFSDAEKLAISITHEFPSHQLGWKVLGAVYGQTGRNSEAVDANQTAVALSPQDAEAHSNLGNTLKELGRLDEASASYSQAIALKPDYALAHNNLGNTLKELGRLDEAEASYTKAIALKADFAESHSNLGVTLKELGRLEESEASLRQAIALKADFAEAHCNLGVTLKELGRLEESEASLRQAIKFKPEYAIARMNLNDVASAAVPAWHLSMMNDEVRNNAYFEAIKLAVNDGSFVLDIGTGSGLLSMMAAASGAAEVITCETSTTIAGIAKKIINSNGYEKNISVINKKSTELVVGKDLPQTADLIISEVLSAEFVGEGVRSTILDAKTRLLKKNGTMIPQSGSIRISLLGNNPEIFDSVTVAGVNGFDSSEFNSISRNKFNLNLKEKPILLSNPEDAFSINFYNENRIANEEKTIQLRANRNGLCLGLIQWLKVQLFKDIEYENSPGENSSHWPTPLYIFDEPVVVKIGDVLEIRAFLGEDRVWFYHLT